MALREDTDGAEGSLGLARSDRPVLMRGAIMAFQTAHGMTPTGCRACRAGERSSTTSSPGASHAGGYSYVFVTEQLPQTLTLWHNGHVVLRRPSTPASPPGRPTSARSRSTSTSPSTTMAGTNPDGTHYNDPGVPWVNYFSGGDAVHGFYRGGYG